jgi:hypothetical protein
MKLLLLTLTCLLLTLAPAHAEDWLKAAATKKVKTFIGDGPMKKVDVKTERRGKVVLRRIKPQNKSDWNTDPTALPYFFYQLRQRTDGKFPAYLDNEGIELVGDEIFDYPIIYFTSHYPFTLSDDEVENLKKYLARGGTLLLDDCTGSGGFTDAVPSNVQRLVPGAKLDLMLIDSKDYRDLFNIVYKVTKMPGGKVQFMQPFQCAMLNGRPAILLCPNDYGCRWEISTPPTALNPLGGNAHGPTSPTGQKQREDTYQLSINWLFYALTH